MSTFDPALPGLYVAADVIEVLQQEAHDRGDHVKCAILNKVSTILAGGIVGHGGLSHRRGPDTIAELVTDASGGGQ